jgi:hypothetical protein
MAPIRNSTTSSPHLRLPRSVEIAGCRVAIRVVGLVDTYGQFTFDDRLIEIDRNHLKDDPAGALETLRHEMMEAALLLTGVGFMEKYDQEPVVRAMEQAFFPAWDRVLAKVARC